MPAGVYIRYVNGRTNLRAASSRLRDASPSSPFVGRQHPTWPRWTTRKSSAGSPTQRQIRLRPLTVSHRQSCLGVHYAYRWSSSGQAAIAAAAVAFVAAATIAICGTRSKAVHTRDHIQRDAPACVAIVVLSCYTARWVTKDNRKNGSRQNMRYPLYFVLPPLGLTEKNQLGHINKALLTANVS